MIRSGYGEDCDDGNVIDDDGCTSSCELTDGWDCSSGTCVTSCGDGIQAGDEACDEESQPPVMQTAPSPFVVMASSIYLQAKSVMILGNHTTATVIVRLQRVVMASLMVLLMRPVMKAVSTAIPNLTDAAPIVLNPTVAMV